MVRDALALAPDDPDVHVLVARVKLEQSLDFEAAERAVEHIRGASANTVTLVAEISQAIAENSVTSKEVATTVENFAALSEENSAAARQVAETAVELAQLAEGLSALTSSFETA